MRRNGIGTSWRPVGDYTISRMKTTGIVHRFIILLLFLATLVTPCAADVCVYKPPVVRQIVGTVVDSSGQPVPGVKVVISEAGTTVASTTTGDAGSFRFDTLKEGAYELAATANGFQSARYKIVLHRPSTHWNRSLQIELAVGLPHCGGEIRVAKLK
jgi:hypothetical protein